MEPTKHRYKWTPKSPIYLLANKFWYCNNLVKLAYAVSCVLNPSVSHSPGLCSWGEMLKIPEVAGHSHHHSPVHRRAALTLCLWPLPLQRGHVTKCRRFSPGLETPNFWDIWSLEKERGKPSFHFRRGDTVKSQKAKLFVRCFDSPSLCTALKAGRRFGVIGCASTPQLRKSKRECREGWESTQNGKSCPWQASQDSCSPGTPPGDQRTPRLLLIFCQVTKPSSDAAGLNDEAATRGIKD